MSRAKEEAAGAGTSGGQFESEPHSSLLHSSREAAGGQAAGGGLVEPTRGNYVGTTYISGQLDWRELDGVSVSEHEAQSSELASPAGAVMLDYLRTTLPDTPENWAALDAWLGDRQGRASGWRGWYDRSAMVLDGGLVASCSEPSAAERQGILVDLPGKACASMGDKLLSFLRWAWENGHITRVDLAIDDRSGGLTARRVKAAWDAGGVVTRWQSCTSLERTAKGGKVLGHTVYLGNRSSESMVRIYDKALEQHTTDGKPWTRLELECKGKLAHAIVGAMLGDMGAAGKVVLGQINKRLRFTEGGKTDSNKRRRQVAAWWAAFLGYLERGPGLVLGMLSDSTTIEKMASWAEKAVGPTLAAMVAADGGDLGSVVAILQRARHRMKPKHKAAIRLYQEALQGVGAIKSLVQMPA